MDLPLVMASIASVVPPSGVAAVAHDAADTRPYPDNADTSRPNEGEEYFMD